MRLRGILLIGVALAMFGQASASYADCTEQHLGDGLLHRYCRSGDVQNAAFIQTANADMGGAQTLPAADESAYQYLANSGNGRYICTPSGFGQIATCRPRAAN